MARKKRKVSMRQQVDAEIAAHAEKDTPSWPEHQQRAKMGNQVFHHPSPGRAVHPHVAKAMAAAPSGLRDGVPGTRKRRRRSRG